MGGGQARDRYLPSDDAEEEADVNTGYTYALSGWRSVELGAPEPKPKPKPKPKPRKRSEADDFQMDGQKAGKPGAESANATSSVDFAQ
jgi:hypothetical protein